jgi:hypothetical protein
VHPSTFILTGRSSLAGLKLWVPANQEQLRMPPCVLSAGAPGEKMKILHQKECISTISHLESTKPSVKLRQIWSILVHFGVQKAPKMPFCPALFAAL